MNSTIKLLKNHRSYRHFDDGVTIPQGEIDEIIAAAQQAPSWMNTQDYSIISITDNTLRESISQLQLHNPQIKTASVFLIFIADLHKFYLSNQAYPGELKAIGNIDSIVISTTDASLAAQNATIAAESLGYGTCYIGGIRQISDELITLLKLPAYTFPLYGLCIGKPAIDMAIKPRLPKAAIYFENQYNPNTAPLLAQYEQTMLDFAEKRETKPWREKLSNYFQHQTTRLAAMLTKQGFLK